MKTCAFIGLGVMGFPMAGHLSTAFNVRVYNRSSERAVKWQGANKGVICQTPAEASQGANVVFVCVGNDDDVRSVIYGETGILAGISEGAILVDHTTTSAELARELYSACQQKRVGFLDSPVSGGEAGAVNGALTIMVGGDDAVFDIAAPVMSTYAKSVRHMGPSGAGQLTKMVNQICIAGLLQGLSEGLNFAERAGLNIEDVVSVISKGAAQSWQMENRAHTMQLNKFDFGFAVDWMRKDLKICIDEGERNGSDLPITKQVDQFYEDVQNMGGGRWDTSSLIARLRAGVSSS